MNKKAVILLSGGLDSATTAAIAQHDGYELHALTFDYGQRHSVELEFSSNLARFFKVNSHHIINIPSDIFKSALLGDSGIPVPHDRDISGDEKIPSTYVPARNILFLSFALAFAESIDAESIYIGANAIDYSGYPDCRPEFFQAFERMAEVGTKTGVMGSPVVIKTPLISMSKSEIIVTGTNLGVDYSLTHSCYEPDEDGLSCGTCDSCQIRRKGFHDAGVKDPTRYRNF